MPPVEELPLGELPEGVIEAATRDLADYSVGFLRVESTPRGLDAVLLGSGTLVSIGSMRVVLTAHHVVSILPTTGRLGLILGPTLQQHTVDTKGLTYLKIARGTIDANGPDLGAVVFAPAIAGAIAARKTFYNLELRRNQLLSTPPDLHDGFWFVNGFIAEKTVEERGRDGYLSGLSRPEQVVYCFRQVVGVATVSKEELRARTEAYQNWVEAFARNHETPIEWAEKGVRKDEYVERWLRSMVRGKQYGVYFIFRSMEQGPTFRCAVPKYPTRDPNHRILAPQRGRFTHYYFYIRDEVLGPMVMRVGSFFPFQSTYYLNGHSFIEQELNRAGIGFRKHDNAFLAVAEPAALQAAADQLNPALMRERLDYWTLLLGPKFSAKEPERQTAVLFGSRRASRAGARLRQSLAVNNIRRYNVHAHRRLGGHHVDGRC